MSRNRRVAAKVSVALTELAISDLRAIERYSNREWGRKTADKYLDEIAAALDHFIENPDILSREPDFVPGLYFYRVRKHVLVCDYLDRTIIVLTILHISMDLPARLAELEPRLIVEAEYLRNKLRQLQ